MAVFVDSFVTLRDGTRLWTNVEGEGPPIVLLNGGPGMADYLAPVGNLLKDGYRVHRYEPRGCGRSDHATSYTLAQFISDLEELRGHWGYVNWTLIGHSWGVDLGLACALAYGASVTALVGIAGGRIHNDRAWSESYHQNRHREPAPPGGVPNLSVNNMIMADWRAYCRRPDLLADLACLSVPALFITGAEDIRPDYGTVQIARLLRHGAHIELAGTGHYPWQQKPQELATAVRQFLSTHSGP